MIDGDVEVLEVDRLPPQRGDRGVTGSPPPYRWLRISRRRIQARREVNERRQRELMRHGRGLD